MADQDSGEVTRLLEQWSSGRAEAYEELFDLVYKELRAMAATLMRGERVGHTLTPTGLVHEAYLRLAGPVQLDWKGRAHFFSIATTVMRRVLVDHARRRLAAKRSAPPEASPPETAAHWGEPNEEVLAVDNALAKLADLDPRQASIVELRFFGGLTNTEIGEVLGISQATVKREWAMARAWLRAETEGGHGAGR